MEKITIGNGVYYIDIPEADLRILCGCPADSVKHLRKNRLIVTREKGGVSYESGPNAILLSDIPIQNGCVSNLAEFPVLHMLYRQGMIIPGHPNNTGRKPRLIGTKAQISAQSRYIYRGNYGLVSKEEIMAAGMSGDEAEEIMRMKIKFAFGAIRPTEGLLDFLVVGNDPVDIGGGVMLSRAGLNRYVFRGGADSCEVDLNLGKNEVYCKPYNLGYYPISPQYFSVVHIGEGDGWDPDRPCMSSILTFQGHIYLIDAGPGILDSLTALGVSVNEIDGIFHTHCHDDHFAGLVSLMRADHRINHYATPLVRAAVIRKFSALLALGEERFFDFFNICDLRFDEWNRVGRLEVMPVLSVHPVETSFFYFRTPWGGGYKTYGHLADIVSLDELEDMVSKNALTRGRADKFRQALFMPVNLKKIDAGKGLIHGNTADFVGDESDKIIMSHSSEEFLLEEKEIGSTTAFGQTDILIPSKQDFSLKTAAILLGGCFPDVEKDLIRMFLDCPVAEYSPGSIILRKGVSDNNIYLVLSGVVEAIEAGLGVSHDLSQGFFIGDNSFLGGEAVFTYRAASPVCVLAIPSILFVNLTHEFKVFEEFKQLYTNRLFLLETGLFGEMLSFPAQNRIARNMKMEEYPARANLALRLGEDILIIANGGIELSFDGVSLGSLKAHDFLGAEGVLFRNPPLYEAIAETDARCYRVPGAELRDIPIIQFKLLEDFKKTMCLFTSRYNFAWRERYERGEKDAGYAREIFRHIERVSSALRESGERPRLAKEWSALADICRECLKRENTPEWKVILSDIEIWEQRIADGDREIDTDFLEYLTGRLVELILSINALH